MKNSKNFWPIGITIFFVIMVCMIILSVYIAVTHKPDDDNAYFSTRQVVDKEINDILTEQGKLEKLYKFYIIYDGNKFLLQPQATRKSQAIKVKSPFTLSFSVVDNNNKAVNPTNTRLYITRFSESKDDVDMGDVNLTSPSIKLKKGDWKVMIEFNLNGKKAYFEQHIIVEDVNV